MNLTYAHTAVLKAVAREGGTAYLSTLASLTGLDANTAVGAAENLVEHGYLTRNGQKITATAEGKRAAKGR